MEAFQGLALVKFRDGSQAFGWTETYESGNAIVKGAHGEKTGKVFNVIADHELSNGETENAMRQEYNTWHAAESAKPIICNCGRCVIDIPTFRHSGYHDEQQHPRGPGTAHQDWCKVWSHPRVKELSAAELNSLPVSRD